MKKEDDVLGGFSAIFGSLTPNEDIEKEDETRDDDFESQEEGDEEGDSDQKEEEEGNDDSSEYDNETDNEEEEKSDEVDQSEANNVSMFFDAIAENIGWSDVSDDEKPKSVEDFVEYIKTVVEENSKPTYANEQIAELDEFIRNGGSLDKYIELGSEIDYDSIDLESEDNQKLVIKEFLKEKGFSDLQIKRKIEKYEDANLLEDEASDAVEFLKEIKAESKKELLETQKRAHEEMIKDQQKFYNNVVQEIETLTDIRGIKVPKEDRRGLMEYIFRVESDGRTRYQKDYAKSNKNLIESAYLTWKGDALIDRAKKNGATSATEKLKNTLRTSKVSGSKQTINNGSPTPLWAIASKQILKRPQ